LTSGASYYIVSRSTDKAGNAEFGPQASDIPTGVGVIVAYDTAPPTAVFNVPAYSLLSSTKAFNMMPTVWGTASGDLGVSKVMIAVQKLGSTSYWFDGVDFEQPQTNPYFLNVTGTNTWTYDNTATMAKLIGPGSDNVQFVFIASATAPSA